MKRAVLIAAFLLSLLSVHAFTLVAPDGVKDSMLVSGKDTLLLFAGSYPELQTSDGSKVDWYLTTDTLTPKQTNSSNCLSLASGDGVAVRDGKRWILRYVYAYPDVKPVIDTLSVTYNCDGTVVTFPATGKNKLNALTYTRLDNTSGTYRLRGVLSFNQMEWVSNKWDSVRIDTLVEFASLPKTFYPGAILSDRPEPAFEFRYFNPEPATKVKETNDPCAIACHPTSVTTIRTATNEKDYPETSDKVSGSAPLNILFKLYPTPNVTFYQWKIYRGSSLITTRTDEVHRYEFNDPGIYRVECSVMNMAGCTYAPDSAITVSISESMLRVPNVFTPNGDGINDEFRVLHRSLREFHCEVYNRWGKLVFQWDDPSRGWDGTINGRPAAEGAYFYVIRALGTDATSGYTSRAKYKKAKANGEAVGVYQLAGDINLLRGKH